MAKVLYERDGRIARITLNRPEVLNAIDDDLPRELAAAVERADADEAVHVIVLSGAGRAFCAGYDLMHYAQKDGANRYTQEMPWDPMKDYAFMMRNTEQFMSLFRSRRPVICKVHGFAVAGGSDIALCSDLVVMAEDARIGYMPVRVWGCPTTAMWVYRLGAEKAKRMLFTGDKIDGREAEKLGLVLKSVPADRLDEEVDVSGPPYRHGAAEPAHDAEADGQPGAHQYGAAHHADDRDDLRRHHPPLARRPELQASRRGEGLEAGRRRARPGHLRLDRLRTHPQNRQQPFWPSPRLPARSHPWTTGASYRPVCQAARWRSSCHGGGVTGRKAHVAARSTFLSCGFFSVTVLARSSSSNG